MKTLDPGLSPAKEPGEEIPPLSFLNKFFTHSALWIPSMGIIVALTGWWCNGFNLTQTIIAGAFYFITGYGVTVGYHRYFTHGAFKATPLAQLGLGIAAGMALEGPLFHWTAQHRKHHQVSDTEEDEHTPHGRGGVLKGFFHAHVGWIFIVRPPSEEMKQKYIPDLISNRLMVFIDRYFPLWVVLSLVLPMIIGGLVEWSWSGAYSGFIGALVRISLVHNITWIVNSGGHMWGKQEFETGDHSTNSESIVLKLVTLGEAVHNLHHKFPKSALQNFKHPWQDLSYLFIKLLEKCKVVSDLYIPKPEVIERALAQYRKGHALA